MASNVDKVKIRLTPHSHPIKLYHGAHSYKELIGIIQASFGLPRSRDELDEYFLALYFCAVSTGWRVVEGEDV